MTLFDIYKKVTSVASFWKDFSNSVSKKLSSVNIKSTISLDT